MNVIVIMIQMAFLFMIQKVRWRKEDISQQQRETIEILVVVSWSTLSNGKKEDISLFHSVSSENLTCDYLLVICCVFLHLRSITISRSSHMSLA